MRHVPGIACQTKCDADAHGSLVLSFSFLCCFSLS